MNLMRRYNHPIKTPRAAKGWIRKKITDKHKLKNLKV
ncbi:protein of unknown function [Xenorhabdus bovienii]|uniref:Uncharacterized protein n=1 Tax=Xenorhabdus bovienii TaxID=40576 RepID=A0A0B6X3A8_XENBV|nr:protein of unknown function [Xenorhabdus bovienii]